MYQVPKLKADEILLYSRKSRTDDPLLTIEEVLSKHEKMMDDWVAAYLPDSGVIPEDNRFREIVSGETLSGRPKMMALLRLVEQPKIKAVLCKEPSRLSRGDLQDIGYLVKILRFTNTLVFTVERGCFDLNDDRDREAFERELMQGNGYLEYQKRIMGNGRLASVAAGWYIGNRMSPYGYNKKVVKENGRKCHTLEPNPETAPVVQLIFQLYAGGLGVERIIDELFLRGIEPPAKKRVASGADNHWAPTTIRTMLSNEHYIGKVRWFHKKTVTSVENGEVVTRRPIAEDYLTFPGKHPAIISQELWDAVQAIRGSMPRHKKGKTLQNIFAGLLYCDCGYAMKRHAFVHKGVERALPRMQCSRTKRCDNASCTVDEIKVLVKQALREAVNDFEHRIEAKKDDSAEVHRQLVKRLEKRLLDLEELEVKQWDEKTRGKMPSNVFDRLNNQLLAERAEVTEALCTVKDSIPEPIDYKERLLTFHAALDLMDDPDAPAKEVNAFLKQCIERITYSRPRASCDHAIWTTGSEISLDIRLRI